MSQKITIDKPIFPKFIDDFIIEKRNEGSSDLMVLKSILNRVRTQEYDWFYEHYQDFLIGLIQGYDIEQQKRYIIQDPLSKMHLCKILDHYHWYGKKIGKYIYTQKEITEMGAVFDLMKIEITDENK